MKYINGNIYSGGWRFGLQQDREILNNFSKRFTDDGYWDVGTMCDH
jgi:hypothetical protein